jgi:Cu-Zn family superoxide dismutase
MVQEAVAVFATRSVKGEVTFKQRKGGVEVNATFTQLAGNHGFHIHKAGDLRGEGCKGACDHYHIGPPQHHGGAPSKKGQRHTGDLGNVTEGSYRYVLKDVLVEDLFGRSVIIHADEDDYGLGGFEDSLTTGHSGKRIACAIIGRV